MENEMKKPSQETIDAAIYAAKAIKTQGEHVAQAITYASQGNLVVGALILRSALAELEYNIHMQGKDVKAYEELRDALGAGLEKAMAKGVASAVSPNSSGGSS